MPIRAVILDLDDTLFMTQAIACEMERAAALELGLPPVDPDVHRRTWGLGIEEALPLRLPGVDPAHYPAFIQAHANQIKRAAAEGRLDQLTSANVAALEELQAAGYLLYVVTSRHGGEAAHLLNGQHPLNRYITEEALYYRERLIHHKPDPRVFAPLLGATGLKPADCLYVGDSVSDCQAATAAGLQFVCCLESGLRTRADFAGLTPGPHGFIETFADLPKSLRALTAPA